MDGFVRLNGAEAGRCGLAEWVRTTPHRQMREWLCLRVVGWQPVGLRHYLPFGERNHITLFADVLAQQQCIYIRS